MDDESTRKALELAQKAANFDSSRRFDEAIFAYSEAAHRLVKLLAGKKCLPILRKNANEYVARAEFLKNNLDNLSRTYQRSPQREQLERAEFLQLKAQVLDEDGHFELANDHYQQVIHICIENGNTTTEQDVKASFFSIAGACLTRAEELKMILEENLVEKMEQLFPSVPENVLNPSSSPEEEPVLPPPSPSKGEKLSKEELLVIESTSNINGKIYVPFLPTDLAEKFKLPGIFTDKAGKLSLTEKQKTRIRCWKRASELYEKPVVIASIDSSYIKQTLISDCSFISSLSIAASYEKRFGKQLVTRIIYPQDKSGRPIYNPNGKYMVKLHINGVWRKIIIDDFFPCDEGSNLLCSQSQRKGELWVSLLEKAYLNVMGGYDFPGSNSNIDLNALTGWIPERISISDKDFEPDKTFEKLFERMHRGHCLITLATGRMTKEEADRAGLVETHAYAVLDLRKVQGKRLLQLKNPWTHLRWKGRYSEKDKANWTPELRKALSYDPEQAAIVDDGVFWIDFESIVHFFDVFYINWDPSLFPFTTVYHSSWDACTGPVKDLYSMADNPQYSLSINNKTTATAVWILLTRHITKIDDFADNKEFITLIVYDSGKKIYIPSDVKPISEGVRINSPHYLCQLVATKPGINNYTLVVAQYEKTKTIKYSLRVYSTAEAKLKPLTSPYTQSKTVQGEWDKNTAGGCGNGSSKDTVKNNPTYEVTLLSASDENELFVELKAPKQYSVGFDVRQASSTRTKFYEMKNSGAFRPGYTVLPLEDVPAGVYHVRLKTFIAGQTGPFILKIESTCGMNVKRIQ